MAEIRLLLVEDDPDFCQVVKDSLELTGDYEVFTAGDGVAGYDAYKAIRPDIIVSDIDMPKMSGHEMVERIKENDEITPIILASAYTDPRNMAKGYNLYIDEYLKKPFLPAELDLRIKAIIRRINRPRAERQKEDEVYLLGEYRFKPKTHVLSHGEEESVLTDRESQILQMLYEKRGDVLKRDDILQRFWSNNDFYASRSLDVFVAKLRKYLEKDPSVKIVTVRGEGLRLE